MSNSTNKISQMTSGTPKGKSTGIRYDSFGSTTAASATNNWISGNSDKSNSLFNPGLDTSSSFFGDLSGSTLGDVEQKIKTFDIAANAAFAANPVSEDNGESKALTPQEIQRLVSESRQNTANQVLEQNKFAVRLISTANGEKVVFKSSPVNLSESRQAVYRPMDVTHLPGAYQIYSHTNPRNWQMTIKLFSRNAIEAEENLATINTLKSWMLPYFGKSNTSGVGVGKNNSAYSAELLGAPPDVLKFTAYSDPTKMGPANIRNVPVVMLSFDTSYPEEVDYIQTSMSKVPFPTIMQINMNLTEAHSPNEFKKFNIVDYKNGNLTSW